MHISRDNYPGLLVLRDFAALDAYDDALANGGSRQELMSQLMALGLTSAEIRWHAAYPGRRMVAIAADADAEARPSSLRTTYWTSIGHDQMERR